MCSWFFVDSLGPGPAYFFSGADLFLIYFGITKKFNRLVNAEEFWNNKDPF